MNEYLDEIAFDTLMDIIKDIHILRVLNPTNTDEFIEKYGNEDISLSYDIDEDILQNSLQKLTNYYHKLNTFDLHPDILVCYQDKVEEEKNRINLALMTAKKDDDGFFESSEKIYGLPPKETVASLILKMKKDLDNAGIDYTSLKELSYLFSWAMKESHFQIEELIYEEDKSEEKQNAEYLKEIFNEALEKIGATYWTTEINQETLSITVNAKERKISIPENRKFSVKNARALVNHEVYTHVKRHMNGLNSKVKLLSFGLAGYESAEEAIARYAEKVSGINPNANRISMTLLISAISGIFDKTYSHKDITNLLDEYFSLTNNHSNWKRTLIRVLRGTTGLRSDRCFTKDHIYTTGYFNLLPHLNDTGFFTYCHLGKFDPLNPKHQKLVELAK